MRTLIGCLASSLSVLVAPAAMAQDRGLAIEYTVKVADIPRQLFHVTTDIRNISQPSGTAPPQTAGWARLTPSTRLSHSRMWFQLAPVRATKLFSAPSAASMYLKSGAVAAVRLNRIPLKATLSGRTAAEALE